MLCSLTFWVSVVASAFGVLTHDFLLAMYSLILLSIPVTDYAFMRL